MIVFLPSGQSHHLSGRNDGDFNKFSNDGVLEPGMVVSVESYIGEVDGTEGVKLEQEVLISERGIERISCYPFDEALLGRQL
jgi:Xaa-Pro aminopeptidase